MFVQFYSLWQEFESSSNLNSIHYVLKCTFRNIVEEKKEKDVAQSIPKPVTIVCWDSLTQTRK